MSMINIAVLFGGNSSEYGVSLQSAASVMENLSHEKYRVYPIGISPAGEWFYFTGSIDAIQSDAWLNDTKKPKSCERHLWGKWRNMGRLR